ncbi:unnamed protein product, partial [Rotaria sp. Silwood1]
MTNGEKQADEILALQSIFDQKFRLMNDNQYEILIEFDLFTSFTIQLDDKISTVQYFSREVGTCNLCVIYAPTTEAEESTIDDFYMDLQQILDDIPKKDAILIIGDWNAKVGETAVPDIVGKFGLGKRNEAGERLIDFCQENHMIITNTCFQQPKRRLYTWTTPNGQHRNQIDYILCNRRWKSSITSIKTRPGADCGTDHELLNGTLTDQNGKHLTNGDEIKNKWKQYTEELYKKEINGTGNLELDDYELEPDILESEVKFAMETLADGKAPGHDGIPIECFKTIKEDAVKILTKLCQQIWKTQKWPQDWKTSIFIPI